MSQIKMEKMKIYGLIGKHIEHSYSPSYFANKFKDEEIKDANYCLFPLADISEFKVLLSKEPNLQGLNVTIPYKSSVIPYLDSISEEANAVGAVNTIVFSGSKTKGYNTDIYGFKNALKPHITDIHYKSKALILGTGGASKAIVYALKQLKISHQFVSRNPGLGLIVYKDLNPSVIENHLIIINTTPLGMSPDTGSCPELPYNALGEQHLLFDLVYNPEETLFLRKGLKKGAKCINGLKMLHLQAEKSWKIWQST